MDEAETRFSWLLKQRWYRFWCEDNLEQRLKVEKTRPDFYVETPWGNLLAEVESFKEAGPIERKHGQIGAVDLKNLHDRLRGPVKHAARQLKPYANRNIPCLVVLDNWRQIQIPTGIIHLVQIFGELEYRGELDPATGTIPAFKLSHGRDRRLKEGQHPYVSAVAVNIAKVRYFDDTMMVERPMRLRIVHNPNADCPMPTWIFQGRDDEQWLYDKGTWRRRWPTAVPTSNWFSRLLHNLILVTYHIGKSTTGPRFHIRTPK